MMDDSASVDDIGADILAIVEDTFDDADLFADGVNVPQYVPQAEMRRQADHELAKGSFHENLSPPPKDKRKKKRRKKTPPPKQNRKKKRREYQGDVDWEKVEKQEFESALSRDSIVMVQGSWQKKGQPTQQIWFPCVIVPRIAWGMEKFDLHRAFGSSDVAVWRLGTRRLGEGGVFWTKRDNIKSFPLSVEQQQQQRIKKLPKKLQDEFAKAYEDADRLVSVVKVNEEIRGARWDRQRQEEEAAEEAKKERLRKAEASLTDEERRKIREAGERFIARVISGMSTSTQANE
jgi:hypothetical protein